jgi:hypothetical protein
MSSNEGAVRYLEIRPNNVPADGKISHKGGIPVINFTIGAQNAILKTDSIRLSGRLHIWRNALGTLVPDGANAPDLMASEKLGVYGTMSQLVWRSAKTKQVCESVRHYGNFMASYLPVASSLQDSYGHRSESALIMPSYSQFQNNIIRNPEVGTEFCCPLLSGMTMGGENLNLMESGFGGLEGEIHLAPDSQFFYSNIGNVGAIGECFYQFQDLKILCEIYVPPPDELSRLMSEKKGVFNFNSITSYMSTIQSSNSIVNFHLGLSRVISAFVTFTPSAFINNKAQNGYLTYLPTKNDDSVADVDSVAFLKGGERFPYHFVVDTNVRTQPDCSVVDPQVVRYFANSIVPEEHQKRCSITPANTNRGFTSAVGSYSQVPEGGSNYGVGVLYDMLNSDGVNFKTEAFTLQMNSGLTDGNPISAFLFVKHKTTLAWNEDGIEVVN